LFRCVVFGGAASPPGCEIGSFGRNAGQRRQRAIRDLSREATAVLPRFLVGSITQL
jgi:hypothetical protein